LNSETIFDVWHGEKMKKAREVHLKKMGVKELPPCKWCIYPRKTVTENVQLGNRIISGYSYVNWENEIKKDSSRLPKKKSKQESNEL